MDCIDYTLADLLFDSLMLTIGMPQEGEKVGVSISQQDGETGAVEKVWPKAIGSEANLGLSKSRKRAVMASMGLDPQCPPFDPPVDVTDDE